MLCYFIKKNKLFANSYPGFIALVAIFLLKFICGLILGIVYSNYYVSGDTFSYLHDANTLHSLLAQHSIQYFQIISGINSNNPSLQSLLASMHLWNDAGFNTMYNDSRTLIKLNAIIRIFSFGYYEVHVLLMSFISLCGLMMLLKVATFYSDNKERLLAIIIFCTPSVLFWGSGLIKESLQIFSMGFVLYRFHKLIVHSNPKNIFYFAFSMLLLFLTRNYIFFAFIPGLIAWGIYNRYPKFNCFLLFTICYAVMLTAAFQLKNINPQFDIAQMLFDKQIIFYKNAVFYPAESLIQRVPFAPSAFSVVKRSPEAFWLTLSQPYIWQCKNPLYFIPSIENIIYIFLLVLMILKIETSTLKTNPLFAFSICFAIVLFVIIGLTTPVVGTMVRYKVPALLFLGIGIVMGNRVETKV